MKRRARHLVTVRASTRRWRERQWVTLRPPRRAGRLLQLAGLCAAVATLLSPGVSRRADAVEPPAKAEGDEKGPVDWRGLDRMDPNGRTKRREKPPPNPVQQLVQNAPYRVHVATTNGTKITITDAYTLERRRIFVAPHIAAYGFSSDGHWLYVAHGTGPTRTIVAVAVTTAKARTLGTIRLRRGESLIELRGHGHQGAVHLTLVVGKGGRWRSGAACTKPRNIRRIKFRERPAKPGKPALLGKEQLPGPHELRFPRRRSRVSPNTRYIVELGASLTIRGRFGKDGEGRLNKSGLPARSLGLRWMRDSRGVFVSNQRRGACRHLKGLASFRQPKSQFASWRRQRDWLAWRVPSHIQLVRGDLAHQDLTWAPDGMRLIGISPRGVVVVEPVVRHGGHVSVIAPPSTLWPAVRPGVRTIATGSGGLRHAEILLEQGQLDAAQARLTQAKSSALRVKLMNRLDKLRRVRTRRLKEFGGASETLPGSFDASKPTGLAGEATVSTR